jgi:O-antigen ligase
MGFRAIKDFTLFLLIFSFINDNFIVEIAGGSSLKAIFGLFIVVNITDILNSLVKASNRVTTSFFIFMAIMTILMLLSVISYGHTTLGAGLMVVVSMIIVFTYISHYENFDRLLYFIWFSVLSSAFISLFNDPVNQWTFRRSGGTMDPNEFSAHLLMAIFVTIYLFYKNKNYIFLFVSQGLLLYALLFAGSKSAMLTLVILGLFAVYKKFGFILKKIFSFKGFIAVLVLLALFTQVKFSSSSAVSGMQERAKSSGTAHERLISWKAGWRMAQDNFLVGVGFDAYEKIARKYATDYIADGSLAPHNIFVKLIAEAGIFAFFMFLVVLYYLFSTKYLQITESQYFWIYLASLSNILIGMTLSITYEKYFWLTLALLANVIVVLYKHNKDQEIENSPYIS